MDNKYSKLNLFGSEGRLGRFAYFLFSFIIPISIFWIIAAITGQLKKQGIINKEIAYALLLLGTLSALFMLIRLTIQRSHDLNRSGWLSIILLLFPPLIAVFWLFPGSKGVNLYDQPTKPLPTASKLISSLLFLGLLLPMIYLAHQYSLINWVAGQLQQLF